VYLADGTNAHMKALNASASLINVLNNVAADFQASYEAELNTFNTDTGKKWNDAATTLKTDREAGKAADQMVQLPEKPCAPTPPATYTVTTSHSPTVLTENQRVTEVALDKYNGKDVFVYTLSGANTAAKEDANRLGHLYPDINTTDTDSTTATKIADVGHVFGRLGQGKLANVGADVSPWKFATSATEKPTMMVSIFPSGKTYDVPAAADKAILLDVSEKASLAAGKSPFDTPAFSPATPLTLKTGGLALAAGFASLAAVTTLF